MPTRRLPAPQSGSHRHHASQTPTPPTSGPKMDMSGIEPDPSRMLRMLSERDNQLHHMPCERTAQGGSSISQGVMEGGRPQRSDENEASS